MKVNRKQTNESAAYATTVVVILVPSLNMSERLFHEIRLRLVMIREKNGS